jgi:hypothetical protein
MGTASYWRRLVALVLPRPTGKAVPFAAAAAFAAAVLITLISDVPRPLPGIALGSEPLFYIERGVAAFGILVVATSFLTRGLRGELPSQVSTTGISYPEKLEQAVGSSDLAITMLAARVDKLDQDLSKRDEVLRLLVSHVVDLDAKIESGTDADRPHEGG